MLNYDAKFVDTNNYMIESKRFASILRLIVVLDSFCP